MRKISKILILDGNSSQCLPVIRSLYRKGNWIALVCPGVFSSGYFSRYVHKRLVWPRITGNEEEFYKIFLSHIKSVKYDLVLGLSDVSTEMLACHKNEIEKFVKTVVPDYEIFSIAANKYLTMQLCMEKEIPCPVTINGDEADNELLKSALNFPVVVKPKKGVGAIGFNILSDPESLINRLPALRNDYGGLLIQEYIPNQKQYTAEVFCNSNSKMEACIISEKARFFPLTGGTSSCNVIIQSPEMELIAEKLLKELKWTGAANIDFILDPRDNTPKVIEINPRIGATVKIAFESGIDFSKMLVNLANDEKNEQPEVYESGLVMRNLFLDLLWFIFSPYQEKKQAMPSFSKFYGKNIRYQAFCIDDPLPIIGFLLGYIVKYANINKLQEKLGIKRERNHEFRTRDKIIG